MAVAVLIPLVVMVLAYLLERFEAHAVPGDTARRGPRASRTSSPSATPARPADARPRHLSVVPSVLPQPRREDDVLDPETLRLPLPHAS